MTTVQQERTGWVGWLVFASVMMGVLAMFHVIAGLVALFKDEYYLVGSSGLVVEVDYSAWGWVHLGLGILMGIAALSLQIGCGQRGPLTLPEAPAPDAAPQEDESQDDEQEQDAPG